MGYAMAIGNCYACGRRFNFNPVHVPSFRDSNGVKQPVCGNCITLINEKRKEKGLEPFTIPTDAYDYCNESELA